MTGCTSGGYDQFETSPEAIEQELRPAVCERRQIDLRQIIVWICCSLSDMSGCCSYNEPSSLKAESASKARFLQCIVSYLFYYLFIGSPSSDDSLISADPSGSVRAAGRLCMVEP